MSNVVDMFARPQAPAPTHTPISFVPAYETMRRADKRAAIARLLAAHSGEGYAFALVTDPMGLRVDAIVGTHRRTVTPARTEADIDNLYGIVTTCVGRWRSQIAQRAALRVLH